MKTLKTLVMITVLVVIFCAAYCYSQDSTVTLTEIELQLADLEEQRIIVGKNIQTYQVALDQQKRNLIAIHAGILVLRELKAKALKEE